MARTSTLRKPKPRSQDEFDKAADRLFAILSEKVSELPPDEQKKKWDALEKYVKAAAERNAKRP